MPIDVYLCTPTDVGCVLLTSGAPEESQGAVHGVCSRNGWRVSCDQHIPGLGETAYFITGPTAEEVREALRDNPNFNFSRCA